MSKGKVVPITLRRHTADGPYVGKLVPGIPVVTMPEVIAALNDSRSVLEEMLRLDLSHSWGNADAFSKRLARVETLLAKLKAPQEKPDLPSDEYGAFDNE